MSKKCLQIKNKGLSWKVSMIRLQKLLRLDSSPPRFLNGQKSLAWLGLKDFWSLIKNSKSGEILCLQQPSLRVVLYIYYVHCTSFLNIVMLSRGSDLIQCAHESIFCRLLLQEREDRISSCFRLFRLKVRIFFKRRVFLIFIYS